MARVQGPITLNLTGLRTFGLGIAPTWVQFSVCEKAGPDTAAHKSDGYAMTGKQFCMATFAQGGVTESFNSNAHVVQHYELVNGAVTKVLSASFDSFTAAGIKLNVDIANNNYQVFVVAGN